MRRSTTTFLMIAAIASCGCRSTGWIAKREAEKCCPTDIRKTVPWCAGEDAIFQGPCEPDSNFYGYKPTCWRTWPTGGAVWRDTHCGNEHHNAVISELVSQNPELIQLPTLESLPQEPTLQKPIPPQKTIQEEPANIEPAKIEPAKIEPAPVASKSSDVQAIRTESISPKAIEPKKIEPAVNATESESSALKSEIDPFVAVQLNAPTPFAMLPVERTPFELPPVELPSVELPVELPGGGAPAVEPLVNASAGTPPLLGQFANDLPLQAAKLIRLPPIGDLPVLAVPEPPLSTKIAPVELGPKSTTLRIKSDPFVNKPAPIAGQLKSELPLVESAIEANSLSVAPDETKSDATKQVLTIRSPQKQPEEVLVIKLESQPTSQPTTLRQASKLVRLPEVEMPH